MWNQRDLRPKLEKREWTFLILLLVSNWLQAAVFSLQGPFYPPEAEKKGVSASVYGTVMGFYRLTILFLCPLFGIYVERIGLRQCFMLGLLFTGVAPVLFGFLDLVQSYSLFLTFSFLLRGLEGAGTVGIKASTLIIIRLVFPGRVATLVAFTEGIFVVGISTGPVLGAFLFDLDGFMGPFLGFGLLQLFATVVTFALLPELPVMEHIQLTVKETLLGFLEFLRIPSILLFIYAAVITSLSTDFISAILQPDLAQFNLSAVGTGIAFLLIGPFQLLSPYWGYLLDRTSRGEIITLAAALIGSLAFMIVGPISFVPLIPTIGLTAAGLLLFGLSQGALMVSCFSKLTHEARENGIATSRASISVVPSYYVAAQALGGFIGPTAAGVLYDKVGFRGAILFPFSLYILLCLLILVFICVKKPSQNQGSSTSTPSTKILTDSESSSLIKSATSEVYS